MSWFGLFSEESKNNNAPVNAGPEVEAKLVQEMRDALPKLREILENLLILEDTQITQGQPVPKDLQRKIETTRLSIAIQENATALKGGKKSKKSKKTRRRK